MENCLVTKLKGTVSDNTLPKLGELCAQYSGTGTTTNARYFLAQYNGQKEDNDGVKIIDGHFLTYNSSMSPVIADTHITGKTTYEYYVQEGATVIWTGKYDLLRSVSVGTNCRLNLADLKYCVNLTRLSFGNKCYGDLANLSLLTKLTTFLTNNDLGVPEITGDIMSVPSSVISLQFRLAKGVYGDIQNIGTKFLNLKSINLTGTSCYGTVESMIRAFRAAGKTNGSIICTFGCVAPEKSVTFNGQICEDELPFGGSSLSWTENTITYGEITINA